MTRINVIEPSRLSDKHLGAAPRVRTGPGRYRPTDPRNPAQYVLGAGHVRFFYPRLGYLRLCEECRAVNFGNPTVSTNVEACAMPKFEILEEKVTFHRIERCRAFSEVWNRVHYLPHSEGLCYQPNGTWKVLTPEQLLEVAREPNWLRASCATSHGICRDPEEMI